MRTSVGWPERPGTKSWMPSSQSGTSATRNAIGNGVLPRSLRRAEKNPHEMMPSTAYSEKCAPLRTMSVARSASETPSASKSGRRSSTTSPL